MKQILIALLIPLLTALTLPSAANERKMLFRKVYAKVKVPERGIYLSPAEQFEYEAVSVYSHYDEFYEKTRCELITSNSGRFDNDPLKPVYKNGEWQLRVNAPFRYGKPPLKAFKFDDGEIVPLKADTIYHIRFYKWRNHDEITFNTGTTYYLNPLGKAINIISDPFKCESFR